MEKAQQWRSRVNVGLWRGVMSLMPHFLLRSGTLSTGLATIHLPEALHGTYPPLGTRVILMEICCLFIALGNQPNPSSRAGSDGCDQGPCVDRRVQAGQLQAYRASIFVN